MEAEVEASPYIQSENHTPVMIQINSCQSPAFALILLLSQTLYGASQFCNENVSSRPG